jgi:ABC-2 type transport system permease protein
MRKVLVIARREYLAAVRTKAFLISLLIMPLIMGGTVVVQLWLKDAQDTRVRHFAVVDLSPGGRLFEAIRAAAEKTGGDTSAGKAPAPAFEVERAVPANGSEEALAALRLDLSDRVRRGDLLGFVEIRPDVYTADADVLRFQTNRVTIQDFPILVRQTVSREVEKERCARAGLDWEAARKAMKPVDITARGLWKRDDKGEAKDDPEQSRLASFFVPFGFMMLMFMVIMMTATPLMQGVVEEKMQRIAEVLLGSVRPFDLMLGKLLGMTSVSLTISAVYLGGAWWAAARSGYADSISVGLLAWFLVYQILAALMYGSLFAAVGAACTDMKETQTLMWPVMVLVMVPLWMLGAVVQEPNGAVVTGLSFFPFATPMLMIARQAVPPGVPWWQPAVGVAGVVLTTLACVWAAGRIFRVGILLQGKGARLADLARWVLRG